MRLFVISRSRTLKYPSCYAPAPHQAFGAEPGAPSALQARRKALGDHDPRPSNTVINESVEYLMEEIIKGYGVPDVTQGDTAPRASQKNI